MEIIKDDDRFRQVKINYLMDIFYKQLSEQIEKAKEKAERFYYFMIENPEEAIEYLPKYIESARDVVQDRAFVESIAGGPNPSYTVPMINVLGVVYDELPKEVRKKGLIKCMNYLDSLNYIYSQFHMEEVHDPWLFSDIIHNRNLYWCGYKEYIDILSKDPSWEEFSKLKPKSRFLLTLAVLRPKYCSLEIRANYIKENPGLVDKTLDGIVAIHAKSEDVENSFAKYDVFFKDRLKEKYEEQKWIDLEQ